MAKKPIFLATHPRACSTAFERVFMTCHDTLQCFHEPFGDPYYFGSERLAERYKDDEKTRGESGYANILYRDVFESIEKDTPEGKRAFIKDMAQYFIPPNGNPATIAPSLVSYKRGVGTSKPTPPSTSDKSPPYPYETEAESDNPTIVPNHLLGKFHFTFLIRHPKHSIPSYWRCTVPPLSEMTGWDHFRPDEAGYAELRRLFDHLKTLGQIGPQITKEKSQANGATSNETNGASQSNGTHTNGEVGNSVRITVIDADALLHEPLGVLQAYCSAIDHPCSPSMLQWSDPENQAFAAKAFAKWKGFHEDVLESDCLRPRKEKKEKSDEELFEEWTKKYGADAAGVIRKAVQECTEDYEYLRGFAIGC